MSPTSSNFAAAVEEFRTLKNNFRIASMRLSEAPLRTAWEYWTEHLPEDEFDRYLMAIGYLRRESLVDFEKFLSDPTLVRDFVRHDHTSAEDHIMMDAELDNRHCDDILECYDSFVTFCMELSNFHECD